MAFGMTFWSIVVAVLAALLVGPLYAPTHVFSEKVMLQVAKNAIKKGHGNSTAIVNEVTLLSQHCRVSPVSERPSGTSRLILGAPQATVPHTSDPSAARPCLVLADDPGCPSDRRLCTKCR